MNTLHWQDPQFHAGPSLPTHPVCVVVDQPDLAGNVIRTPHVFGGLSPLVEVASRIAAGLDPRTFLRPEDTWDAQGGIECEAMLAALDRAVSMSTIYAHKLLSHCSAVTQMEIEHAQQAAAKEAAKQHGRTNGKRVKLP